MTKRTKKAATKKELTRLAKQKIEAGYGRNNARRRKMAAYKLAMAAYASERDLDRETVRKAVNARVEEMKHSADRKAEKEQQRYEALAAAADDALQRLLDAQRMVENA